MQSAKVTFKSRAWQALKKPFLGTALGAVAGKAYYDATEMGRNQIIIPSSQKFYCNNVAPALAGGTSGLVATTGLILVGKVVKKAFSKTKVKAVADRSYIRQQIADRIKVDAEGIQKNDKEDSKLTVLLNPNSSGEKWGKYKILKWLGKGGMSEIFLALDQDNEQLVVVKRLNESLRDNADVEQRLENEASGLIKLGKTKNLRHLMKVYEYVRRNGQSASGSFFAAEYIEGCDLSKYIEEKMIDADNEKERLNLYISLSIFEDVINGLEEAVTDEGFEILHRDLKPGNIRLRKATGEAVLIDFGIAKDQSLDQQHTMTDQALGTGKWMSPETFSKGSKNVDRKSDIFQAAAILFNILTGEHYFNFEEDQRPDFQLQRYFFNLKDDDSVISRAKLELVRRAVEISDPRKKNKKGPAVNNKRIIYAKLRELLIFTTVKDPALRWDIKRIKEQIREIWKLGGISNHG